MNRRIELRLGINVLISALALSTLSIAPATSSTPSSNASMQSTSSPTLTTCTNLETGKTLVLRSADAKCRTHLGSALWVAEQSDSPSRTGVGYRTISICSSKNPLSTYRFIRDSCPKFQVTTNYWRTLAVPSTPVIEGASARGHDSAVIYIKATTSALSAPVHHYLVTETKSGLIRKVLPGNLGYLSISGLSAESTYSFTVTAVNVDGTSEVSRETSSIRTSATPVVASTTQVALTCATGGTCVVGDRGPGGGIVFYVSTSPFTSTGSTCNTTCKYLEVAPATWQSGGTTIANDTTYQWSNNKTDGTVQLTGTVGTESGFENEKFSWKIGQGFYNTSVMKVAGASSTAQAAVLAYAGSVTAGEWFIPSANELNELCKYSRGQLTGNVRVACDSSGTLKTGTLNDLGGFVSSLYMSSSEWWNYGARSQYFNTDGFGGNRQRSGDKDLFIYVRPIRAF